LNRDFGYNPAVADTTARGGAQRETFTGFWFFYLLYLTAVIRTVASSMAEGIYNIVAYAGLAVFLVLSLLHFFLGRKPSWLSHLFYVLQIALVFFLLQLKPLHDYYAILYVSLGITAGRVKPEGTGIFWLVALCAASLLGLFIAFGPSEGFAYLPSYIGGILLVGLYGRATVKATEAKEKGDLLLMELEEANRKLKAYAEGAKESAAVEERARLARELHDAVTQTIFSMNLTAEAARMAHKSQPARVPALLDRLQELARDALAEMRSMVEQLRQQGAAEAGLVSALEKHLALRERRDGLKAELKVEGEERGSAQMREALFRTAQEALNNVLRHSGGKTAEVSLRFGGTDASLSVKDDGIGFDAGAARGARSFGLHTMKERVEALGGSLGIESAPGKGTVVRAAVPLDGED
jgi:signal transduction histidine kinase